MICQNRNFFFYCIFIWLILVIRFLCFFKEPKLYLYLDIKFLWNLWKFLKFHLNFQRKIRKNMSFLRDAHLSEGNFVRKIFKRCLLYTIDGAQKNKGKVPKFWGFFVLIKLFLEISLNFFEFSHKNLRKVLLAL